MLDQTRRRRWLPVLLAMLVMSLVLAACSDDDDAGNGGGGASGDIETDMGVTEEPCPGGNPERGCIYLGTLTDQTGVFAALAIPLTEGQKDFWDRVNREGGIAGQYDVNIERYLRDNEYNPQTHVQRYREVEGDVLALAQSLGTTMTLAALDLMKRDDMVANAGTWWSGWAFPDDDDGLVLESGHSYCVEAMNGLDYAAEEYGKPEKVLQVGYPGDYGGDGAAGTRIWGRENDVEVETIETAPNAAAGNQDAVVGAIRREQPDVVFISTAPQEMAEIVGKAVAGGFEGRFMGAEPTYNNAVLESEAGPAITQSYRVVMPHAPYGADTPAHRAMEEANGDTPPDNDGYTFGWTWSYPLKAVLDAAAEKGDLTREGLRDVIDEVTVDYEGALPDKKYGGGDPNANIVRESIIAAPDPEAPLGLTVEQEFTAGPTAQAYQAEGACAEGA